MLTAIQLTYCINAFIAIPVFGFLLSLIIPEKRENLLSRVAFLTAGLTLLTAVLFIANWMYLGFPVLDLQELTLYESPVAVFLVDFFFDEITAVYLFIGAFLTFLITIYSRYYLHREKGYKRFFNTILFFFIGYNVTIFSGNFETLFIGWEILGISSFLLIAFYRERYLPVRNALKVFSIYRVGDVGILLAMWASHHLWHENITFLKLNNYELVHEQLQNHSAVGIFISMMLLIAAAAKSAQLPFSSWLPRAMEGPTPSSAIFYGSLSVHFGVFLLLRTFPFWEEQWIVRIAIGGVGLITALVATANARVQSSIKTQIAYSSIAQIGIIFMEVAAGFEMLALIHFAGNAFMRTYQLLVSPSVVSYLIRDQLYHYKEEPKPTNKYSKKLVATLYQLGVMEFRLDDLMHKMVFRPLRRLGHQLDFITRKNVVFILIPAYIIGLVMLWNNNFKVGFITAYLPQIFSFLGLLMVLRAFGERKSPGLAWVLLIFNHFWMALAISFNEHFAMEQIVIYLSGVVVAGVLGYANIYLLRKKEPGKVGLNQYYGHVYEHPRLAFVFLIACLGLMGFPITPTFIGEDLVFGHIHADQFFLALFNTLSFIVGGIAIVRIYARLYLGTHCKNYHETSLKSS